MRVSFFFRFILSFVALASSLLAGSPPTQTIYTEPDSQVTIRLTPVSERWSGEGFLPVRVRVENAADSGRAWTFRFETTARYTESIAYETALAAGPASAVETVVFVPGNHRSDDGAAAWTNVTVGGPGASSAGAQVVSRAGSDPFVVTAVSAAQEIALLAATNGAPGPKAEVSVVNPADWPADWRVWSPFQRVVLTEPEYAKLDGARRAALGDWVAMGGVLDLYASREGEPASGPREERRGLGVIRRPGRLLAEEERTKPGYAWFHHGIEAGPAAKLSADRQLELKPSTGRLGLSLFLAGFGLLIGPINLFVFAPSNRRQRLFITVPALSLAASALMCAYIVMKDGFGGEGSRRGLVVLLPASNQAVIEQTQAARTGVLLGSGFALADDIVLVQANSDEPGHMAQHQRYVRGEGGAGEGWFASRRYQEQTLRQLVPTRARVELVSDETKGAPVVQSSVGATLRDFVYRDSRNRLWTVAELPPGHRVTLAPPAGVAPLPVRRAGEFAALGGAAEGLAPISTLKSIRWDEDVFLYTGPLTGARTP